MTRKSLGKTLHIRRSFFLKNFAFTLGLMIVLLSLQVVTRSENCEMKWSELLGNLWNTFETVLTVCFRKHLAIRRSFLQIRA